MGRENTTRLAAFPYPPRGRAQGHLLLSGKRKATCCLLVNARPRAAIWLSKRESWGDVLLLAGLSLFRLAAT